MLALRRLDAVGRRAGRAPDRDPAARAALEWLEDLPGGAMRGTPRLPSGEPYLRLRAASADIDVTAY